MHLYKVFIRLEARYKLEATNIGRCSLLSCAKIIVAIAGVCIFWKDAQVKNQLMDVNACMDPIRRKN